MHTYDPHHDMPLRKRIRLFRMIVGMAWQALVRRNSAQNAYVFFRVLPDGQASDIEYVKLGNVYAQATGCKAVYDEARDDINAAIVLDEAKQILNQAGERE